MVRLRFCGSLELRTQGAIGALRLLGIDGASRGTCKV